MNPVIKTRGVQIFAKAGAQMKKLLSGGLIVLVLAGACLMWYGSHMNDTGEEATDMAYFNSPRQAVEAIKEMQREGDWASLARFYDLSGSSIDRATLISGEFFIRTERPEAAHPGGFWRYKHPFPPSFDYAATTSAAEVGVVIVRVSISIDQGAGAPTQEGWQEFSMRESEQGFQILPDNVEPIDLNELPADPDLPSPDVPED